MEQKGTLLQEQIEQALSDKELPHIYFNGFITTVGTGDILIVLRRQDRAVAVLNASYTVAKTLVEKIGDGIKTLEARTQHTIMTTEDVATKLSEGKPHGLDSE